MEAAAAHMGVGGGGAEEGGWEGISSLVPRDKNLSRFAYWDRVCNWIVWYNIDKTDTF